MISRALPASTLAWFAGCAPESPHISGAEIDPAVVASWNREVGARTRVEVTAADGERFATPWEEPGWDEVSAALIGLAPAEAATAVLAIENGPSSMEVSFSAGGAPQDFPNFDLVGEPDWDGYFVLPVMGTAHYLAIFDPRGTLLWTSPIGEDPQVGARPQLRRDGGGFWIATMHPEPGFIDRVAWTGHTAVELRANGITHDFYETESGDFIWIDQRCTTDELGGLCPNQVQRGAPGGEVETLWDSLDTFDPLTDGERLDGGDWLHANALNVYEDRGTFWVGLRNESALLEFDLASGALLSQVGGTASTFTPQSTGATTEGQHRFQVLDDDSIVVMDNRVDNPAGSRVALLQLDRDAGTVELLDEYVPDPPRVVYALGDVNRWDDGSTLATWTTTGVVEELDAENEVVSTLSGALGTYLGYTLRVDSLPCTIPLDD